MYDNMAMGSILVGQGYIQQLLQSSAITKNIYKIYMYYQLLVQVKIAYSYSFRALKFTRGFNILTIDDIEHIKGSRSHLIGEANHWFHRVCGVG